MDANEALDFPITLHAKTPLIIEHYCIFGPGGLRAPCVLACAMRSLDIVQSFSLLLSPSFAFDSLRGISRVRTFVSPNILAKKNIFFR